MSQDSSTQVPVFTQEQLEATAHLFNQPEQQEEDPQYHLDSRPLKGRGYKHAKWVHKSAPTKTQSAMFGKELATKISGAKGTYCKRCLQNGK